MSVAAEEKIELTPEEVALCQDDGLDTVAESQVDEPGDDTAGEQDDSAIDGGEAAREVAGTGREAGSSMPSWMDEETVSLAIGCGLSMDEAKEFGSKDVIRKFAVAVGRQRPGDADARAAESGSSDSAAAAAAAADATKTGGQADGAKKRPKIDPEAFRQAGYNDEIVAMAERLASLDELEDRFTKSQPAIDRFNQAFQENQRRAYVSEFHDTLDELDADVFGRSLKGGKVVNLPESVDKVRRAVWEESERIVQDMLDAAAKRGEQPQIPPRRAIIVRAANALFAKELVESESRRRIGKVREQSRKRRPSPGRPSSRSTSPRSTEVDEVKAVAESPEIKRFWDEAQAANGTD